MSDGTENENAERVLKFNVWEGPTNHRAVVRAGLPMKINAVQRGLTELLRLGYVTHHGDVYTITNAGRAAQKALLGR